MRVLVIEVIGAALVVGGVGMMSVGAALIVAGAFAIVFGVAFERARGGV